MIPKQCIIIGGGSSIRPDRSIPISNLELWKHLKNTFTIGTNFSYKWFTPTVLMYKDYTFYYSQQEALKEIPLIVGMYDQKYFNKQMPKLDSNVLLVKDSQKYNGINSIKLGCYVFQLIGLASISFAIGLGCTEIFLLGMDGCAINGHTHFYDEEDGQVIWNTTNRSGVGQFYHKKLKKVVYRTGNYNNIEELNNCWYKPFEQAEKEGIKIYNVSLASKIDTFLKIDYLTFYKMLVKNDNQEQTREIIRKQLS